MRELTNTEAVPNRPVADASVGLSSSTDEELMQSIIDRHPEALNYLYARYRALLGKIVSEILPNDSDAEEALQDIFMEIWTRAANFDVRKGKPLGWIICMTRRRAIDHYRKIRRRAEAGEKLRQESGEGINGEQHPTTTVSTSNETLVASDLRRFLNKIVRCLPAEQEQVVQMSYFKEMSQREIAARTGIPLGTIKTRLDLALRKLAQKSAQFREELYYAH